MYISRVIIRNFRNFKDTDVYLQQGVSCLVGENNTGKSNFLYALRLVLDASHSSSYRSLTEHDVHASIDITKPNQVLVSVEFSDFAEKETEDALVGGWQVPGLNNIARLTYRFRPKENVQNEIIEKRRKPSGLSLDDYHWQITGGGNIDPGKAVWSDSIGVSIRFSDLQLFLVVFLHALRGRAKINRILIC